MINKVLAVFNCIAIVIILQVVFDIIPCIPCSLPDQTIEKVNDFAKDLAVGVITSTIFYYLVVICVDNRRNKKIRAFSQGKLQLVFGIMQKIVSYYAFALKIEDKDDYLLKLDSNAFLSAAIPTRGSVNFRIKSPKDNEAVGRYDGSTELGLLNYFASDCERFSHQLSESMVLNMDDMVLIQLVHDIEYSSLIRDIKMIHGNTIPIIPPGYNNALKQFYELYKKLSVYVEPQTIEANDSMAVGNSISMVHT